MGRPIGSKNKPRRALNALIEDRLRRLYGKDFSVIEELADQCVKIKATADATNEIADRREAVQALNTLAKYMVPQLRAIEHSTDGDDGLLISVNRKRYDGSANEGTPPSEGE
jgi:hypothetical protein